MVWSVREESVRTSGIPGLVTHDQTPINLVWNIGEFREDCIRDPIYMTVDAPKQDRATAKKRFTIKIILFEVRAGHKPTNEGVQ